MNTGRWTLWALACVVALGLSGCASLERQKQLEMALRNLEAEKAQLEMELSDGRGLAQSLRSRSDSLESQLAARDSLVGVLERENDRLEESFRNAQIMLEKFADTPIGPVIMSESKLPPELDTALQQFASQYPSAVVYHPEYGTVKWSSDVVFALGSDVVKETAHASLNRFGEIMQAPAAKDFEVLVVGHTDDIPIRQAATRNLHPTNWHLSAHRAISVAAELRKSGLQATRVGVTGFGEYRPIVPNDSDENRARNRRVEMYIVPRGTLTPGAGGSGAMSFTGETPADPTK